MAVSFTAIVNQHMIMWGRSPLCYAHLAVVWGLMRFVLHVIWHIKHPFDSAYSWMSRMLTTNLPNSGVSCNTDDDVPMHMHFWSVFPASPILRLYLLPSCFARRAKGMNFIGLTRQKEGYHDMDEGTSQTGNESFSIWHTYSTVQCRAVECCCDWGKGGGGNRSYNITERHI